MPSETQYKNAFRKLVGVWSEAYEPARGSGNGYPDLQLLLPGSRLVPVEVKTGVVKDGVIYPSRLRPSQITWHHDFATAGGKAFILVCCGDHKAMDAWVIPSAHRKVTAAWRLGWEIWHCPQWVTNGRLTTDLSSLVAGLTASALSMS